MGLVLSNRSVYICFVLSLAMLATSPGLAADAGADVPGGAGAAGQGKKVVVRADRKTGKLVTRVITYRNTGERSATSRPAEPPADISGIVAEAAEANHVDPLLVHSVIEVESAYNPWAVSPKGAQGLMQLMPATARELGVENSFDPRQNIEAGVRYLKYLQDLLHDDRLALAAYNAGPAAVQKYRQVPPYPETQEYVKRVDERYRNAQKAAGSEPAPPEDAAPETERATAEDTHPKLEQFVDEYGRLHLRTAPR